MPWLLRSKPTDTGTLDITSLAVGMTAGRWTVRRIDKLVYMTLSVAKFAPTSSSIWQSFKLFPVGFRPVAVPSYIYVPSMASRSSASTAGLRVSRYGDVDIYDILDKDVSTVCTWVTDDAWPAAYPGVKL